MAFLETPRFPENIALGAQGGPVFSTAVVITNSGDEWRDSQWQYPLHRWDVSQGIKNLADFTTVRAYFMAVGGRARGWRFKDFSDFKHSHGPQESGRVLGLTSTTFQLVKRYATGSVHQDRKIIKPVAAGFALLDGATVLTPTTDYTLSTTTGIVTTTASRTAANLSWQGEFDVPCRFDTDALEARHVGRNPSQGRLYEWGSIPIVEMRRP
jgi:uncharacterized protein (TIGR02217 family)